MWRERGGWRVGSERRCSHGEGVGSEKAEGQPSDDCSESELVLGDAQAALSARRARADAVISAEVACKRRALGVALWLVPRTSN